MDAMEKHAEEQRKAYEATSSKNKGKFYKSGQVWRVVYNNSQNRPAKVFKEKMERALQESGIDPPAKAVYLREARHWDSFYHDPKATEKTKPREPSSWKLKDSGFNLVAVLLFNEPVDGDKMQECLDTLDVPKVPGTLTTKKEDFLWKVLRQYKKPNDKNGKEFIDFIWGKGTAASDREAHRQEQIRKLEELQAKLVEAKNFTGAQEYEDQIRELRLNVGTVSASEVARGISSSAADVALPIMVNVLPADEDGDGRQAQSLSQTEKVMAQMRDGFHTAATHLLAADLGDREEFEIKEKRLRSEVETLTQQTRDLDKRMEEKTKENAYFASAASDAMAAREVESAAWAHQRTTLELGLAARDDEIDSLKLSQSQLMKASPEFTPFPDVDSQPSTPQ